MGVPMCCEKVTKLPPEKSFGESPRSARGTKKKRALDKEKDKDTNPQEAPPLPLKEVQRRTGSRSPPGSRSPSKDSDRGGRSPKERHEGGADQEAQEEEAADEGGDTSRRNNRKSFGQLQRVESKEEKDFATQAAIAARLIAFLDLPKEKSGDKEGKPTLKRAQTRISESFVNQNEAGPQLEFPVTFEAAEALRAHYTKNGGEKRMNDRIASQLLTEFTEKYKARHKSSVSEVTVPTEGKAPRLIIVGDTHGQLQDVLYIFNTCGPPSASNVYLFNGDVADRGAHSSEIFFMIFAYFLADERSILMNRGNHESEEMNALEAECGGGFRDEVLGKYDSATYWKFVAMMKALQLVTVINKKVFVVHGGLSGVEPITIDFIRSIDHTAFTMPPPDATAKTDQAFNDFLWSDPMDKDGKEESSRGVGVLFGPDATAKFIKDNPPIKLMVRSHQLPAGQRGFQKQKGGKCITIFSASNYCGDSGNQGAVMIFEASSSPEYTITEHYAPTLDMMSKMVAKGDKDWASAGKTLQAQEKKQIEDSWRTKELQTIMVAIVETKPDIWKHIIEKTDGASLQDFATWEGVLQSVIGGSWRWDIAWQTWKLGDADGETNGKVNIADFLQRFTVVLAKEEYMSFKLKAITAVYEAILHEQTSMADILEKFDRNGDGTVDMHEMHDTLSDMDVNLTSAQKDSLLHSLFKHAPEVDGVPQLKVQDFLSRFTIVYKRAGDALSGGASDVEQRLAQEAMSKVGQLIAVTPIDKFGAGDKSKKGKKGRKSAAKKGAGKEVTAASGTLMAEKMEALFALFDADGSGELDLQEFEKGVMALPGVTDITLSNGDKLGRKQIQSMAKAVDHSGDGSISILELLEAFTFEDTGGDDMGDSLAEHMLAVLFRHRQALRTGSRCFDKESTGSVTRDQFFQVLMALNKAISGERTSILESQACDLCDALASEGQGGADQMVIVYEDFFNSFTVVDRQNPAMGVRLGRRKATMEFAN